MARRSARTVNGEYADLKSMSTVVRWRSRAAWLTALPEGDAMATS